MGIGQQTIDDHGAFVEKFKPKRTTDDRHTPPEAYGAIKDRACREYGTVTNSTIEYADGAQVDTGFVTGFGDDLIRTAPDLANAIDETVKRVGKERRRHPPKYAYPREPLTVSGLGKIGRQVEFRVNASDVAFTPRLASQKAVKKAIFGGGHLMGEAKAAEPKAAEPKAAEDVTVWPPSENEKRTIENLG